MWNRTGSSICLLCAVVALPAVVSAKVYQCEGRNGAMILTDQPRGREGCAPIDTPSPTPPGGFTPTPEPTSPPAVPEGAPHPMPSTIPTRPINPLDRMPAQAADAEPPPPAAPEAQRCSPRVNPLNPFAGLNCSSASGDQKGETKKP